MEFVKARWFTIADRGPGDIDRFVFHTIESPETTTAAEAVARDFATRSASNKASAHYAIDNNSVVQCVKDKDIAFHAAGDNERTLGFEHAGRANQTKSQWDDEYSRAMLELSAKLVAGKALRYSMPVRWLTEDQLRRRERGFVTHDLVSKVFGANIRDDPGPNFPYDRYLRRVNFYLDALRPVRFAVVDGEGTELLGTSTVNPGSGELARLGGLFVRAARLRNLRRILRALRADGNAGLRRIKT